VTETKYDSVLQRIGLTEEEAQGLLPLSALAQMVDEAERKHGREWVDQNAALLRDEWLHIQKM